MGSISTQVTLFPIPAKQVPKTSPTCQEPIIVIYNPDEVSDMLKSFYEVNRIVKSKVINHHFVYKMKYPDYKKALLELTKKKLKLTNKS